MLSPVKGVVEKINVLRGTVLVNEGDLVDVNTPLVGAYHTLKSGEKSPTFVVARITVIEQTEYFYKCHTASEESVKAALSLAEFFIGGEIISKTPAVVDDGIVVKLKIRHTIYGG